MATALTEFLPYVLPNVPACPDTLAVQALRSACIEFCRASLLVQEVTTDTLVKNIPDYAIEIPTDHVLVKVMGVWCGDKWLTPTSVENLRSGLALRGSTGSETVTKNPPQTYFQKTPTSEEISVYPVPSDTYAEGLAIRSAFAPSRNASQVADVLYENWAEEIAWGALSRLHAVPEQSFYSVPLAESFRQKFAMALRKASNVARAGQVAAASRVQPIAFAL